MSNNKELLKYLVGNVDNKKLDKESYLLGKKSINKVTMISGEWGSGKTYFWNDIKCNKLDGTYNNIYISLYGKDSIKSIENELFMKAYNVGLGRKDGETDIIEKMSSTFSFLIKGASPFLQVDSSGVDELKFNEQYKKASKVIDNEIIICFDDFERKSSRVDLNDLFGFITNLSIKYKCKIVIILNSDSFKDEDAKVFARVKEKTVNKYFSFSPSHEYLFEQIIKKNEIKFSKDINDEILKLIDMTDLLNARVYEQIILNVDEYKSKKGAPNKKLLKIIVLNTIYFNLYHNIIKIRRCNNGEKSYISRNYPAVGKVERFNYDLIMNIVHINSEILNATILINDYDSLSVFKKTLVNKFLNTNNHEKDKKLIKYIEDNDEIYNIFLYINHYRVYENDCMSYYDEIDKVLRLIETGILI